MKRNTPSYAQNRKLEDVIMKHKDGIVSGRLTQSQVAQIAAKEVGFPFSAQQASRIANELGIKWLNGGARMTAMSAAKLAVVARAIIKIADEFKIDLGEELKMIARGGRE